MQYLYNTFVVTSTSHPNLWVTKLFHIFKFSLSLDPTSVTNPDFQIPFGCLPGVQDTLFGLLSNLPGTKRRNSWSGLGSNGAGLCSKKGSFEYRPHWFFCSIRFSVLMSSKTWTSARQRHWCWTFLLETCFSWFLVLGLRQFCRSFNLYVVEQTSAIKTRNREMLTVACSVFLFN